MHLVNISVKIWMLVSSWLLERLVCFHLLNLSFSGLVSEESHLPLCHVTWFMDQAQGAQDLILIVAYFSFFLVLFFNENIFFSQRWKLQFSLWSQSWRGKVSVLA